MTGTAPCRSVLSLVVLVVFSMYGCVTAEYSEQATLYDTVLANGRVLDPESGLDAVRNVGIIDGRIAVITDRALSGNQVVDVSGQVVSPGFINIHSHAWTPLGQEFELRDGVTTALEQEAGSYPIAAFGTYEPIAIADTALINFGASVGYAWIRSYLLDGDNANTGADQMVARALSGTPNMDMETPAFRAPLSSRQHAELRALLFRGLEQGGLGIGLLLDYMSEVVDDSEMQVVFDVAASSGAPIFVHVRRGVAGDTSGLRETIRLARSTGAQVHICHVQASAMQNIEEFLRLIRSARRDGVNITTESFPYNAGSTAISAAVFSRDWQKIFGISYEDVEWLGTGERLNEQSWSYYRKTNPGGLVAHHYNREEWTSIATNADDVIVASDGGPIIGLQAKTAPFGVGTNSRVLGLYVRDKGTLSLMNAISKMTLQPAQVLEKYSPAMARKGRIRIGADADITVFDPNTIIDHATFAEPFRASSGVTHVIVGGQFVLRDGIVVPDTYPGKRVLR